MQSTENRVPISLFSSICCHLQLELRVQLDLVTVEIRGIKTQIQNETFEPLTFIVQKFMNILSMFYQGCSYVSESGGARPFPPRIVGGPSQGFTLVRLKTWGGPGPPGPLDNYIPARYSYQIFVSFCFVFAQVPPSYDFCRI